MLVSSVPWQGGALHDPSRVRSLLQENARLKNEADLLRKRLSCFLATNVRLESLTFKQSAISFNGEWFGTHQSLRVHELNDDVIKRIMDFLVADRDLAAINRLRTTCKSLYLIVDSIEVALQYRLDRHLRWDPTISVCGVGVQFGNTFKVDGAQCPGSIAWLAAADPLPASGRLTWEVTIEHEHADHWGEHLIGVCDEQSTYGWGVTHHEGRAWNASREPSGNKVSIHCVDRGLGPGRGAMASVAQGARAIEHIEVERVAKRQQVRRWSVSPISAKVALAQSDAKETRY